MENIINLQISGDIHSHSNSYRYLTSFFFVFHYLVCACVSHKKSTGFYWFSPILVTGDSHYFRIVFFFGNFFCDFCKSESRLKSGCKIVIFVLYRVVLWKYATQKCVIFFCEKWRTTRRIHSQIDTLNTHHPQTWKISFQQFSNTVGHKIVQE